MEMEYGASQPIRFAKGVMRDCEGNIIKCKCGKDAGSGMMGRDSYTAWCEDCSPYKDAPVAHFVYRPPA